jgi:hypothetical protein
MAGLGIFPSPVYDKGVKFNMMFIYIYIIVSRMFDVSETFPSYCLILGYFLGRVGIARSWPISSLHSSTKYVLKIL